MNIVKSARKCAEMNQSDFAEWLSEQTGMKIRFQNVSAWERGKRAVPCKVRNECLPFAVELALSEAGYCISDTYKIADICERLKG